MSFILYLSPPLFYFPSVFSIQILNFIFLEKENSNSKPPEGRLSCPPACLAVCGDPKRWEKGVLEAERCPSCVLWLATLLFGPLFHPRRAVSPGSGRSIGQHYNHEPSGHHLAGWWPRILFRHPWGCWAVKSPMISLPLLGSVVGGGAGE